jgi:sterol desaturase/sphingolipid hydroxylase (fatty acid hydroxylase superfamily)
LLFALIAAPAIVAGSFLVGMGARSIGIPPLIKISADTLAGTALATVAVLFVADLFQYWLHRAQHASPFLWRFHSVHHSVEEMGALSGYHHVTEPFIHATVIGIPLAVLFTSPTAAAIIVIVQFQGNYLHSATRLNFGPFARIIVDNRVHRIHHSNEGRHFDKNFGTFTLLWDWLFGTAYFPRRDEWPTTGIIGQPETKTVGEYLMRPFRYRANT